MTIETRPLRQTRHGLTEPSQAERTERAFRLALSRHVLGFRRKSLAKGSGRDLAGRYLARHFTALW